MSGLDIFALVVMGVLAGTILFALVFLGARPGRVGWVIKSNRAVHEN